MSELYDTIGLGYAALRQPDPRWERRIAAALGAARCVVNVGAGSGSYEPRDRTVVAVEPSRAMLRQRRRGAAPAVQARAEALPFRSAQFDAALAILTIHHWKDLAGGLSELRRVARGHVVIVTWDPDGPEFWLMEYFPELLDFDRRSLPSLARLRAELGRVEVLELPVPHDCSDGFLGAYWRRPAAYLDERVRSAISGFHMLGDLRPGLERLAQDLASGAWERSHGSLLQRAELQLGYRLVLAG
jgi:SAM-dependent methyltransferase